MTQYQTVFLLSLHFAPLPLSIYMDLYIQEAIIARMLKSIRLLKEPS